MGDRLPPADPPRRQVTEGHGSRSTGPTDVLHRMHAAQASFSANDAVIATFVQRNPLAAALSTADQLADTLNVSKAAIVRFAARLGYRGFTDLREDLRRQAIQPRTELSPTADHTGINDVRVHLSTKLSSDLASLSSFVQTVDQRQFQRCAELLVQPTSTIFVAGQRRGFATAVLAQRLFSWVRPGVRLWRMDEPGLALALDEIRGGDVVLAFAFRRFPRVTGVLLDYAREVGASSILVTESLTCPYAGLADMTLLCTSAGSFAFNSSLTAIFCVEALAELMITLVGADDVDGRIRELLDSRHASRLEDADEPGSSQLPKRARRETRGRPLGRRA